MSVEPKALIKQVPLPIPSHQGVAIQARSDTVYNATTPTRDQIRRDNYDRRRKQLTQQGFHCPINEPYEAVGGSVCLETKKLLSHALGQSEEVLTNFCSLNFRIILSLSGQVDLTKLGIANCWKVLESCLSMSRTVFCHLNE